MQFSGHTGLRWSQELFFFRCSELSIQEEQPKDKYIHEYVCMYVYIKISNYLFFPPSVNKGVLMALDQ